MSNITLLSRNRRRHNAPWSSSGSSPSISLALNAPHLTISVVMPNCSAIAAILFLVMLFRIHGRVGRMRLTCEYLLFISTVHCMLRPFITFGLVQKLCTRFSFFILSWWDVYFGAENRDAVGVIEKSK
jgi:hypothetical protein